VVNRKIKDGICAPIRESDAVLVSADVTQQAVYKGHHVAGTPCFGLLNGLIDRRGFRNAIQKKDLIESKTKDVEDRRVDLAEREMGCFPDDPIQAQAPSNHSLNQLAYKGPVPIVQIGICPEEAVQDAR
jgi:hypothetical protein